MKNEQIIEIINHLTDLQAKFIAGNTEEAINKLDKLITKLSQILETSISNAILSDIQKLIERGPGNFRVLNISERLKQNQKLTEAGLKSGLRVLSMRDKRIVGRMQEAKLDTYEFVAVFPFDTYEQVVSNDNTIYDRCTFKCNLCGEDIQGRVIAPDQDWDKNQTFTIRVFCDEKGSYFCMAIP